jgi:hypothetical protein
MLWNFYTHTFYLNITRPAQISFKFRSHVQKLGENAENSMGYNENFRHHDDLAPGISAGLDITTNLYFILLLYYVGW